MKKYRIKEWFFTNTKAGIIVYNNGERFQIPKYRCIIESYDGRATYRFWYDGTWHNTRMYCGLELKSITFDDLIKFRELMVLL
jgi:hypothetical protein